MWGGSLMSGLGVARVQQNWDTIRSMGSRRLLKQFTLIASDVLWIPEYKRSKSVKYTWRSKATGSPSLTLKTPKTSSRKFRCKISKQITKCVQLERVFSGLSCNLTVSETSDASKLVYGNKLFLSLIMIYPTEAYLLERIEAPMNGILQTYVTKAIDALEPL